MGRLSITMIIGLSTIFLVTGRQMSDVSFDAMNAAIQYYESTQRYNLAVSAASMACSRMYADTNWKNGSGFSNIPLNDGYISAMPRIVSRRPDTVEVVATGIFNGNAQRITIYLQQTSFARFAYFSNNDPSDIWWFTGETCWGPYHTNTRLNSKGKPKFIGPASSKNGISYNGSRSYRSAYAPQFLGSYTSGIEVPFPSDVTLQNTVSTGTMITTTDTVYMTFNDNGTVTIKIGTGSPQTYDLSTYAANGLITVKGADLKLKGVVNGRVSVASTENSSGQGGTVWIDDDITYKTPPPSTVFTDPPPNYNPDIGYDGHDMLGIIAQKNIYVSQNLANNSGDINIQATMFALEGGFGAQNYNTRKAAGQIRLFGGVIQNERLAVGTVGSSGTGFTKNYFYDTRMLSTNPPGFPRSTSYEVISWNE